MKWRVAKKVRTEQERYAHRLNTTFESRRICERRYMRELGQADPDKYEYQLWLRRGQLFRIAQGQFRYARAVIKEWRRAQ